MMSVTNEIKLLVEDNDNKNWELQIYFHLHK